MMIRKGSNGDEVKLVQDRLRLVADGIFGNHTRAGVRQYQRLSGLVNDGIVGPNTWESMFGMDKAYVLVNLVPNNVIIELSHIVDQFKLAPNTELRIAHFLAQCAHESIGFTAVTENLNYSETALLKVFPKYFTEENAKEYARKPEKIANRVYANRMKNGNEESGDGWKYRGRGFIQLTGRENYTAFSITVPDNVVDIPDLVATVYPLRSAAWFWNSRSLNKIADTGATEDVVKKITHRVNGGYNGLKDRQERFVKFYEALTNA